MAIKRRRPQLSPQEQADARRALFIDAYLEDPNGTQAAIAAGYSPRSAAQQACRLLNDAKIKGEIDRRVVEREARRRAAEQRVLQRYEISSDRIKGELARLAFSNLGDYGRIVDGEFIFDLSNTTRDELAAVHTLKTKRTTRTRGRGDQAVTEVDVETSFRLADKRAALVDLGKATGLFSDGPDINIPVTFIVERTARSKGAKPA